MRLNDLAQRRKEKAGRQMARCLAIDLWRINTGRERDPNAALSSK